VKKIVSFSVDEDIALYISKMPIKSKVINALLSLLCDIDNKTLRDIAIECTEEELKIKLLELFTGQQKDYLDTTSKPTTLPLSSSLISTTAHNDISTKQTPKETTSQTTSFDDWW